MKKRKLLYIIPSAIFMLFILSGCKLEFEFFEKIPDPELRPPDTSEDSAIDDLTPITIIGDDVAVPVYKCSSNTDCDRCSNGDVYGQTCINETCQGSLDLIEDCKDTCSSGKCIDKDILTGDEIIGSLGEDFESVEDSDAVVNNEDLLTDITQCSPGIEKCPNYQRGIGSVYLTTFPECKCTYIYVPPGCNPMDPPCSDFSTKTDYPNCACKN